MLVTTTPGGGSHDGTKLTTSIREQLTTFTGPLASLFSDRRRQQFITDMLTGLVSSGHVHLKAVARGISGLHPQDRRIHAVEKRLSRHLGSEHWDMSPLKQELLQRSAALVTDDALIAADSTDLAKPGCPPSATHRSLVYESLPQTVGSLRCHPRHQATLPSGEVPGPNLAGDQSLTGPGGLGLLVAQPLGR